MVWAYRLRPYRQIRGDMGFFDRIRGKRLKAKWETISDENIEGWYKDLDDQDVERVFEELQGVINNNNKKKALIKASVAILKMAADVGIKVAKG